MNLSDLASIQDVATELLVVRALRKSGAESLRLQIDFRDTSVSWKFGDDRVCEIDDIVEGFRDISANPGHELFSDLSAVIDKMLARTQGDLEARLNELGVDPSRIEDS